MNTKLPIILASGSPRRKTLLERLGIPFSIHVAAVDEKRYEGEPPQAYTERLARMKGKIVARILTPPFAVLSADTIVALDGDIIGKPAERSDALAMLLRLSDKTHTVFTSVALIKKSGDEETEDIRTVATQVTFRKLYKEELEDYIATPEPYDKAGAYAIQGLAASFVDEIHGSFTNVVGFPVKTVIDMLVKNNILELE